MTRLAKNHYIRKVEAFRDMGGKRFDVMNVGARLASAGWTDAIQTFFAFSANFPMKSDYSPSEVNVIQDRPKSFCCDGNTAFPIWIFRSIPFGKFFVGFRKFFSMFNREKPALEGFTPASDWNFQFMESFVDYCFSAPKLFRNLASGFLVFSIFLPQICAGYIDCSFGSCDRHMFITTSQIIHHAKNENGANSANFPLGKCRASRGDYERLPGRVWRSGLINITPINVPVERHDMTRAVRQRAEAEGKSSAITKLIITNISPTDTPVLSFTGTTRAQNVLHEWQTDTLKTPTANAIVEGAAFSDKTVTPTVRLNNYTQILTNEIKISETQLAVKSAGRADEEAYQTEKGMKELANDIEYAFVVNSAAVAGASGTARQLKGLAGWVVTNQSTATANRALTSTILDALLKTVWLAGGKPDIILTGGTQKIAFTNTTNFPGMTRNISASMGDYKLFVDVYQGGVGGSLKLMTSTVMGNTLDNQIFCLQMDKFRKAFLRPIKKQPIGKLGDSESFQLVAEVTLESLNEKASGVVKNLS